MAEDAMPEGEGAEAASVLFRSRLPEFSQAASSRCPSTQQFKLTRRSTLLPLGARPSMPKSHRRIRRRRSSPRKPTARFAQESLPRDLVSGQC